jgi:hypothetical protein
VSSSSVRGVIIGGNPVNGYERVWHEPEAYLGGVELGAIVGCPNAKGPSHEQFLQRFAADSRWMLVDVGECQVLLNRKPRTAVSVLAR